MAELTATTPIYGVMAEFASANDLVSAARQVRDAGYRRTDAYTPYPIEEVTEALGVRKTTLPLVILAGGILGCAGGFFMQYYSAVISYPLNVGGRPPLSWPSFIPVTFEMTILTAGLFAVLGMLALNGLPMPYHPVFNVARFSGASRDRFFLCIEARDARFDRQASAEFLRGLGALDVFEVPH
jgi:hypothetical protein